MRYRIEYLSAGRREATQIDAVDAAAAVATVAASEARASRLFELLAVLPERAGHTVSRLGTHE